MFGFTWTELGLMWYGVGLLLAIPIYALREGIVKVNDLPAILLLGGVGPIWLLITLLELLKKLFDRHKEIVLWRSHKKKTEHILYGDKEDDNSSNYPTGPWQR